MVTKMLGLGAAGGIVAACWGQLKLWAQSVRSVFIVTAVIQDAAAVRFHMDMASGKKMWRLSGRVYRANTTFDRSSSGFRSVPMEALTFGAYITVINGWPVCVQSDHTWSLRITTFRGFNFDKLILHLTGAWDAYRGNGNTGRNNRFVVNTLTGTIGAPLFAEDNRKGQGSDKTADEAPEAFLGGRPPPADWRRINRIVGFDPDNLGEPQPVDPFSFLYLTPEASDAVLEAELWFSKKQWYASRDIAWKRGWLLTGPPGTGKTAFVRALGQHMDFPVFRLDLATMSNQDLIMQWKVLKRSSPCIALIEDIDTVFCGRENVAHSDMELGVTFDCLLQVLDGAEVSDGIIQIITTNHLECIDPALGAPCGDDGQSTRPGRIDRVIRFNKMTNEQMRQMAEAILGCFNRETWADLLDLPPETGAQFKDRCCRRALHLFWKESAGPEKTV